jgi:hypothetical protein
VADIDHVTPNVCFVPEADKCTAANSVITIIGGE